MVECAFVEGVSLGILLVERLLALSSGQEALTFEPIS
jgi:hypothetical protein